MVALGIAVALLLLGALTLIPIGLRAGDRADDALLLSVEPNRVPCGARVTVVNRSDAPVIVGMSLRGCGLRLRLEGGTYVRVRTRRTAPDLMPERQAALGVLGARERGTFLVLAEARVGRRAELIAVIGQPGRLRTIHRLVRMPPSGAAAPQSPLDRATLRA